MAKDSHYMELWKVYDFQYILMNIVGGYSETEARFHTLKYFNL